MHVVGRVVIILYQCNVKYAMDKIYIENNNTSHHSLFYCHAARPNFPTQPLPNASLFSPCSLQLPFIYLSPALQSHLIPITVASANLSTRRLLTGWSPNQLSFHLILAIHPLNTFPLHTLISSNKLLNEPHCTRAIFTFSTSFMNLFHVV